jgi:AraC family transcriptional regulator
VIEGLAAGRFFGERVKTWSLEDFKLTELAYSEDFEGTPPHCHERSLMKANLGGTFNHSFGSRNAWLSVPWTLDYCPSGVTHWHNAHRSQVHVLVIEIQRLRLEADEGKLERLKSPVSLGAERCHGLVSKLYRAFNEIELDTAAALEMEGILLMLLAEILRFEGKKRQTPQWLCQAHEIVHERFRESLRLTEIAREVGVHPVWLASTFHDAYRQTVGQMIRQLRVQYASEQLISSERPLAEIALQAGFSDQSHFSNMFRRLVGVSPTQFRRNSVARCSLSKPYASTCTDGNGERALCRKLTGPPDNTHRMLSKNIC